MIEEHETISVSHFSLHCPNCDSVEIDYEMPEIVNSQESHQLCRCYNCKAEWFEVYVANRIYLLKSGDPEKALNE